MSLAGLETTPIWKIGGGEPAWIGGYPFQVSIMKRDLGHICGGAILNAMFILTAAHCIYQVPTAALTVRAGEYDRGRDEGTEQERSVAGTHVPDGYVYGLFGDLDIAIIQLSSPFTFTNNVYAISFHKTPTTWTGQATVSGWGELKEGGPMPNILQKLDVAIVNRSACQGHYVSTPLRDNHICAFGGIGKDACRGDSGGPLSGYVVGNYERVFVGVGSFGMPCWKGSTAPAVFTNVSKYGSWIINVLKQYAFSTINDCRPSEVWCDGESRCIPQVWLGGREDCTNGTTSFACPVTKFHCVGENWCLPLAWRCDGDRDCLNGSDEAGCPTLTSPGTTPESPRTTTSPTLRPNFTVVDELGGREEDGDIPNEGNAVKPTPFMRCALPFREFPRDDAIEDVDMNEGVMFGTMDRTSRLEFFQSKVDGSKSEYQIEFKTSDGDGLIFMSTMLFDKTNYIALFLRKGFLHFAFDSGAGPAFLNSSVPYNDTKWHNVSVSRFEQQGTLEVDGVTVATGMSVRSTTEANAGNTVYVGGIPPGFMKNITSKKLLHVDTPFRGCLRKFKIGNSTAPTPSMAHSVHPCRGANLETGMFFYPNAGFLKLSDEFKVGRHIMMSMSIKPRHPSGILVAVHGKNDFMVLQLVNGTLKFSVDSGKGVQSSSFEKDTYDLCDGNWHTIRVTKSKNVVTLALDKFHSNPGIGPAGRLFTDTDGPLYVGGHPDPSNIRAIETTNQFVGCMKDFLIAGKAYKLDYESIIGRVGFYSCPSD